MAGPETSDTPGQELSFPTWAGTTETIIWIKNKDDDEAEVVIQAGAAGGETLKVAAGKKKKFARKFGGLRVRVVNSSGNGIVVWTV